MVAHDGRNICISLCICVALIWEQIQLSIENKKHILLFIENNKSPNLKEGAAISRDRTIIKILGQFWDKKKKLAEKQFDAFRI